MPDNGDGLDLDRTVCCTRCGASLKCLENGACRRQYLLTIERGMGRVAEDGASGLLIHELSLEAGQ
jgi:hypothetical protein